MGKQNRKKNVAKPVYKPYLRGAAAGAHAARRGLRVLGYTAIFAFVYVLLGTALSFDTVWLRVLLNGLLLAACAAILFAEGSRQGENDVAFAEIARARLDGGKEVDAGDRKRCYHPLKGFFTAAVGIAPVFLLALLFSFLAHRQTYTLGALPSWVAAYQGQPEIGRALDYYAQTGGVSLEDVLRVIVRVLLFPMVNMAGVRNAQGLYAVDKLSPLLCLILPLFYGLGYLRGPYLRALVHGNIRLSRRRHNRDVRKAREKRRAGGGRPEKKELI